MHLCTSLTVIAVGLLVLLILVLTSTTGISRKVSVTCSQNLLNGPKTVSGEGIRVMEEAARWTWTWRMLRRCRLDVDDDHEMESERRLPSSSLPGS
jgi:hypothetical protein